MESKIKWPWKKKSSDKAALERAAAALESAAASLVTVGSIPSQQEMYKKPNYVQITAESYAHLTLLESQVKTYQKECQVLENKAKTYKEQSQALENKVKTYQEECHALEDKVKIYQEQCQTYENQVETYEEQFQTLGNKVKTYQERCQTYENQVKTYEEQFQALENKVKTYQEQGQTYENQVETYEEQFQTLENQIDELNEKLSQAWSEVETKEHLVKQHAKVAEDAVRGWEKAETEVIALKSQVDSLKLSKRAAEDRAAHLDSGLEDYMRQISKMKDEHAQELRDVVFSKAEQWDKIKHELEIKIANLEQQLLVSDNENATLSRSLEERDNLVVQINEEKTQAEAEIEYFKEKFGSYEKEINSLKYELHMSSKELEIRTEEKNMSVKSADVATKQYMDGLKKITRLEAECQRLCGLVRKKLPGPAALAQMKSEVETLDREYGDIRTRRALSKPFSPNFNSNNTQKFLNDNEFLTDRLVAMEEEMKMLKEALAKRDSELQASRNKCAKSATKLQRLEAQLHSHNKDPLKIKLGSRARSLASMSDGGTEDSESYADSWSTASASDPSQSKKANKIDVNQLELMDDFLEMEKLVCTPSGSNVSVTHFDNLDMTSHEIAKTNADVGAVTSESKPAAIARMDESPILKLRTSILSVFESLSIENDIEQTVESLKTILQNTQRLHTQTSDCAAVETDCSDPTCNKQCCLEGDMTTTPVEKSSPQNSSQVSHWINDTI